MTTGLVTLVDAALYIGRPASTLRRWVRSELLPEVGRDDRNRVLVRQADVWKAERTARKVAGGREHMLPRNREAG